MSQRPCRRRDEPEEAELMWLESLFETVFWLVANVVVLMFQAVVAVGRYVCGGYNSR